jgi:hypothetical protein
MILLRTLLYTTLIVLTNAARHTRPSPPPAWYSIWKIRAGPSGSQILDAAERHGVLRGYKPPHVNDPKAMGINTYAAHLAAHNIVPHT